PQRRVGGQEQPSDNGQGEEPADHGKALPGGDTNAADRAGRPGGGPDRREPSRVRPRAGCGNSLRGREL
ncbi:MAG: hypothetical protein ACYC61_29330, partial [Isosphaeraceae bacterium]